MPTTREVEAQRVERMRRNAAQAATRAPAPKSAQGRRAARADAAHAVATAPARWLCRVEGCTDPGPHPAASREAALAAADGHYARRHYIAVPPWADDWQAAGKPRLTPWLDRWLAAHPDTPTVRGVDTARPRA